MKTTGFILALVTTLALGAAPVTALTPSQSASAAAKARQDALAHARSAAEAKARVDAQAAGHARVEAAIAAQKKAAVETFLRSQAVARAKPDTKPAYVLANVPRQGPSAPAHVTPPASLGSKPAIHRHHAGGAERHTHHATTASGHSR
jgi:hypothetical protein